jgi:serine/threonine protein kinase/tetratricopeptide (TPR) repeat protein
MSVADRTLSSFESQLENTGRFRLVRRLGAGGAGLVYCVHDRERGEDVALKTLSIPTARAIYDLKREFRVLADVTHPNLVALHELFCVGRELCFTMELVDGVDFCTHVRGKDNASCDYTKLRAAFVQLVDAVHALHAAGRLHLDIKPDNVLVDRKGRVVLLDFGLARAADSHVTQSQTIRGTPAYMSPEQVSGESLSASSDWYSVGSMLHHALVGEPPFMGSALSVLVAKHEQDPEPPHLRAAGVERPWSDLSVALMTRKAQKRPAHDDIARWLGNDTGREAPKPASGTVPLLPFVGREDVLARLESAYASAQQGTARAVFVHGHSGIGKTAVCQEYMRHKESAIVLEGRCFERESVPYKALDSVIDALSRLLRTLPPDQALAAVPPHADALLRVFPVLASVPALASRQRVRSRLAEQQVERDQAFQALKALLTSLSAERPVIMFMDDLQWGDRDSALLLRELLAPPCSARLLVLGTYRSDDAGASPFLRSFERGDTSELGVEPERIGLAPLPTGDVLKLLEATLLQEGADPGLASSLVRECEGSPFFAGELVRSVARAPAARSEGSAPTLEAVLLERIAALPASERKLIEAVSVIGRPIEYALLAKVSGLGPGGSAALDTLRKARFVRTRGNEGRLVVEPYHDRVREIVSQHVAEAERARLHRALARELEARRRGDEELLMLHYAEAGERERAAHYAVEAARLASAALAFDHAARLLTRALELADARSPGEHAALHAELGRALEHAGRSAEAADAYLQAAAHETGPRVRELRLAAAQQLLVAGHYQPGVALLREVLPAYDLKLAASSRSALFSLLMRRSLLALRGYSFRRREEVDVDAELLKRIDACYAVATGLGSLDFMVAADIQSKGVLLSLEAGEPMRVLRALIYETGFRAAEGGSQKRTSILMQEARELAKTVARPEAEGMVAFGMGFYHHNSTGKLTEARGELERGEQLLLGMAGLNGELVILRNSLLTTLEWLGDVAALNTRVPAYLQDAERRGDRYLSTCVSCAPLFWLAREAVDDLDAHMRTARTLWPEEGLVMAHVWLLCSQAHRDVYMGQGRDCVERMAGAWQGLSRSLILSVPTIRIELCFPRGRAALQTALGGHEPKAMLRMAEADARALEGTKRGYALALASLVRASIAATRGRHDATPDLLRAAAGLCDAEGLVLHAHAARLCLGKLLGGDEGKALATGAERNMRLLGVRDAGKLARCLVPGFET